MMSTIMRMQAYPAALERI